MGPNGNVCSSLVSSVGPDVSTSARRASGRRVRYKVGKKKDVLEPRPSLMPPNPDEVRRVTCMRNWRLCCTSAHIPGPGYREAEEGDPWELQMRWVRLLSPTSETSLQQSCSKVWGLLYCLARLYRSFKWKQEHKKEGKGSQSRGTFMFKCCIWKCHTSPLRRTGS